MLLKGLVGCKVYKGLLLDGVKRLLLKVVTVAVAQEAYPAQQSVAVGVVGQAQWCFKWFCCCLWLKMVFECTNLLENLC